MSMPVVVAVVKVILINNNYMLENIMFPIIKRLNVMISFNYIIIHALF